ncbi:hypothetical protein A1A1_13822 [Planococcus antarcticus DSM 14505]|uniref:Uncharacterized protein n=1 Tax=Planococcus antarcticus DSM 14505 TaxID=1185653 RepID=A0AA87IJU5_9BACL|nr:hypothetical protein [Planococcus antarcticus]EIM05904.1 hypothetical protein A1A1_13822 [Planococcus antarcticus DSM 14505]
MLINVSAIQKMVKKVLMYQVLTNFDAKIKDKDLQLTHRELSVRTGRAPSWFNNSFTGLEDLQVSSFLRILAAASERSEEKTGREIDEAFLRDILTSEAIETANALNRLAVEDDNHLLSFIQSEETLFLNLISYWGILNEKNKLDSTEEETLNEIRSILNTDSGTEQEEDHEQ